MRIVHRIAGEPPLEQIAAPALAGVDVARITPVRFGQRRAQPRRRLGHEDEVHMIVHQTPGEATHLLPRAARRHQPKIEKAIRVGKEDRLPPIAALRHMMRGAGNDDAREAGHAGRCSIGPGRCLTISGTLYFIYFRDTILITGRRSVVGGPSEYLV